MRQVSSGDAAVVWVDREGVESAPAVLDGDAVQKVLATMLEHVQQESA